MSQKKYCPFCGKANEYINGIVPTKCGGCSKEFASAFKVEVEDVVIRRPKKKAPVQKIEIEVEDDEDYEEEEEYEEEDEVQETRASRKRRIAPIKFEYQVTVPKKLNVGDLKRGEQIQSGFNPNLGSSSFE